MFDLLIPVGGYDPSQAYELINQPFPRSHILSSNQPTVSNTRKKQKCLKPQMENAFKSLCNVEHMIKTHLDASRWARTPDQKIDHI